MHTNALLRWKDPTDGSSFFTSLNSEFNSPGGRVFSEELVMAMYELDFGVWSWYEDVVSAEEGWELPEITYGWADEDDVVPTEAEDEVPTDEVDEGDVGTKAEDHSHSVASEDEAHDLFVDASSEEHDPRFVVSSHEERNWRRRLEAQEELFAASSSEVCAGGTIASLEHELRRILAC